MSLEFARVTVSGRVQGVWFRESTRRAADAAGVTGWVRNLPDGRVEALFEGDADALDALVAFVRVGPPHAKVTQVDIEARATIDARSFSDFQTCV